MSHFSVAVIHRASDDLEEIVGEMLAPYQENNMGNCPSEYLAFNDVEDRERENYENGTMEMIKTPDGELVFSWDERFRVEGSIGIGSSSHKVPEGQGYEEVTVPFKEYYTFEKYMEDYCGFQKDEEMGRYGYWENPNAKWDWYEIGGRFSSMLLIKEDADGFLADDPLARLFNQTPEKKPVPKGYRWVDSARIKDIDFEKMLELKRKQAEEWWEAAQKEEEGAARYFRYGVEKDQTKEQYINDVTTFSTYAVINDDGWHQRGEMGWFGISTNEQDDWVEWYMRNFIENEDKEKYITIVDCHI